MTDDPALALAAAEAFRQCGVDSAAATRAGGNTNATWLCGDLVVRVAAAAGEDHLLREARLGALLPSGVGYPGVVATGESQGHHWVAMERVDAVNLDEVWASLDEAERVKAAMQMWEKATLVHRVDPSAARSWTRPRSPFYPTSAAQAHAGLERLREAGLLGDTQLKPLHEALDRHWAALPDATLVLNHGDCSPVNALWDGKSVVSLLDFEFAVIAPVQVDLNELAKLAFTSPSPHLREAVIDIALPLLRTPADIDLLIGFSIQLETWLTEKKVARRAERPPFQQWECYRMLAAHEHLEGGYYAPFIAALAARR